MLQGYLQPSGRRGQGQLTRPLTGLLATVTNTPRRSSCQQGFLKCSSLGDREGKTEEHQPSHSQTIQCAQVYTSFKTMAGYPWFKSPRQRCGKGIPRQKCGKGMVSMLHLSGTPVPSGHSPAPQNCLQIMKEICH